MTPITTWRFRLPSLLAAAALLASAGPALATLAITNGGFGTTNRNAQTVDGGGWFESTTTTAWVEGSWANGAFPATFPAGSGMALLMDGSGAVGYVYQSLGTVDAAEIAVGMLQIKADFAEKSDGSTNDARFDVLVGSFSGAHGSDILGGGLTSLGSFTLDAAAQGLTQASGNQSRATNVLVGSVDISGLTAGDEVWLRIGEVRNPADGTTGDLIIDNVVMVVPVNVFWDGQLTGGGGGASDLWDTSSSNWNSSADFSATVATWSGTEAIFGGTGGIVTLGEPVTAPALTFTTAAYEIAGAAPHSLTLSGAPSTIVTLADAAISAPLADTAAGGATKTGGGVLTLSGDGSGFTGALTITQGRVNVDDTLGGAVIVENGATLGGEGTIGDLTLGSPAGATLAIDAGTSGAPTVEALDIAGSVTVLLEGSLPSAPATITLLHHNGTVTGNLSNLVLSGTGIGRAVVSDTGSSIILELTVAESITFTNAATFGEWFTGPGEPDDPNFEEPNWDSSDGYFFDADTVTFDDSVLATTPAFDGIVSILSPVEPASVTVDNTALDYMFTGQGIGGSASLAKNGSGVLVLSNPNTYTGGTVVNGGSLLISGPDSIPAAGAGVSVASGAEFGFMAGELSDAQVTTLANNVTWSGGSMVFYVATGDTVGFAGDLTGGAFESGGAAIVVKGGGTLDFVGAALPVTPTSSDGSTITGVGFQLKVTNGSFGTVNQNAQTVDGGGWFESTTATAWVEGSWANGTPFPAAFPAGSGMALLMDGSGAVGYVYQSLGQVTASEIAMGTLRITADFAEKSDGSTNDARFDLLVGSFPGAHGSDILGGGLTSLGSFTLDAAAQGLTQASGNQNRATNVQVGSVDISGLTAGDEIWLRIGEVRNPAGGTTGDLIIDNVAVQVTELVAIPTVEVTRITRTGTTAEIAFSVSTGGNVDVYKSLDLRDFTTLGTPYATNQSSPYQDHSATEDKAFYILVPTGLPFPAP